MPLSIQDLKRGDRVILNCPKSAVQKKREAIFLGLRTRQEIEAENIMGVSYNPDTFRTTEGKFASFQLSVYDPRTPLRFTNGLAVVSNEEVTLNMALFVDPDGRLHDDLDRTVYIERRVLMGVG